VPRDDGLQAAYERVAAAVLWRAVRDVQRPGIYARGARVWLQSADAAVLAAGLGLDLCALQAWVQNQETVKYVTGKE